MEQESALFSGNWVWGCIWIFYAWFYASYFGFVASRLRPNLETIELPGSPERLKTRQLFCKRFALLMIIPTVLEMIQPSLFTALMITVLPCLFGGWVMYAVWREVLNSKIPKSPKAGESESR
ncbi:MAG: hypothetical protein AAGB46_10705 [Verrucomicrobiota bacterium]